MSDKPQVIIKRFAKEDLIALKNGVHVHLYTTKRLREEGIPVLGVLQVEGVERGVLKTYRELIHGREYVTYEWTDGSEFYDDGEI